jgi:2,3-dihydroxybenzoate decarboxylase
MKKIAFEEHIHSKELGKIRMQWTARTKFPDLIDKDFWMKNCMPKMMEPPEKVRIPLMDEAGIDIQVLSPNSPSIQGILDPVEAVEAAVRINDDLSDFAKKHPERFFCFASLPLQNPQAAADELERCVTKLGFKGAIVHGHTNFHYLDERQFDCVWAKAEELDVPISLHVIDPALDQIKIYEGCHELLGPSWNWNVENATHILRMVCNGVFKRFPKAKLIAGHMGEGLPYYLGRIDEGFVSFLGHSLKKIDRMPSDYIKNNIYVSTSGKYFPPTLRCAIDAMGIDKIIFATDFPFFDMKEAVSQIESSNLSDYEKECIYFRNAEKLLHI